ncbi:MAG TPA: nitroreductase family protein [Planctomycetota bacterium]|nr:nitroreductase family protein [Planctomycetota bacterium]
MSARPETKVTPEVASHRRADFDILPLFLNRWSPRAMTGEPLGDDELFPLFEAARWAPSSYNSQLWRFIVARRQEPGDFQTLLKLMWPVNQAWVKEAAAILCVISRQRFESDERPSVTHVFDAGAAWENLALEAARRRLVAHGIEGFDYDQARQELGVPADYDILAMIALGRRGPAEQLPENARAAEHPNQRRPLSEILFRGRFGSPMPPAEI